MREIIGNNIVVFLKRKYDETKDNIAGLLVEVTDRTLYVQTSSEVPRIFAIPKENVEFCTTDSLPPKTRQFVNDTVKLGGPSRIQKQITSNTSSDVIIEKPRKAVINRLNTFVNGDCIASIPIPPTFPVDQWNDKIMKVVMGNPEVRSAVTGKVQKSIEYFPGEVYIEIDEVVPPSQIPEIGSNTFEMDGSPITENLNPSQMIGRLNKTVKGIKNE
jgi:hypothetical protein